jgi:hypothetical protein
MSPPDLPSDVWDVICSFACMDGGATGCALSRVSHSVRAASGRSRFLTVTLQGWGQIHAFDEGVIQRIPRLGSESQNLDATTVGHQSPMVLVRHLFIAGRTWSQDGCISDPLGLTESLYWEQDMVNPSGLCFTDASVIEALLNERERNDRLKLVQRILSACAPVLFTLSAFGMPSKVLLPDMPVLYSLSWHHEESKGRSSYLQEPLSSDDRSTGSFPTLRRAHLLGFHACQLSPQIFQNATNLETLRISRPGYDINALFRLLKAQSLAQLIPAKLSLIVIQPSPSFLRHGLLQRCWIPEMPIICAEARILLRRSRLKNRVKFRYLSPPNMMPLIMETQLSEAKAILEGNENIWDRDAIH